MNILDTIVKQKHAELAKMPKRTVLIKTIKAAVKARGGMRDFAEALRKPRRRGSVALIAEVKKASPSAGIIRADFDPVEIARQYERAGADCLSVLTDEKFFQGSLHYLRQIRDAVGLPLLRKDFIVDERQILESIEWGADAVLLIVAILTNEQLKHFHMLARKAGLTVLVEVHDEVELERALAAGAEVVGVNNRNLKTFTVDLNTTKRLATQLRAARGGKGKLLVAESGIHKRGDVKQVAASSAQAILVGESLMRHKDIAAKTAELLGSKMLA